jgi:hypothetical protein
MVDWALRTSIPPRDTLIGLVQTLPESGALEAIVAPPPLGVVILAGNVFTACIRAIAFPLLVGVPVIVKVSSSDDALPLLLREAWCEALPECADALQVVSFPGADEELMGKLLTRSDLVMAYGSDHSLRSLRSLTPTGSTFVGHGHGLGALFVPASALPDEASSITLTRALALDIAAYDQRGCFSPHAIIVEDGGAIQPQKLAEILAKHGLSEVGLNMPRGAIPQDVAAQQLQWRGVAAARGALFEGDGFSVSFEGNDALRLSPGWRNVQVVSCADKVSLYERLAPLGHHLKVLGVAASMAARRRLARGLPQSLCPRITNAGTMQIPGFTALADGLSPWLGLQRWIELG